MFTYGTLMRGEPLHRVLARGSSFVEVATARGRLVHLGRYPGLIAGSGTVRGELYRVDEELLPVLDREEGYNFVRRQTIVTLANGRRARAWVYRYAGPRASAPAIPEGDWRSFRTGRTTWP